MYPEDLQKEETNEEVVQEILRSNCLAKQTMKSVTQSVDFYTNAYTQTTKDQKFIDVMPPITYYSLLNRICARLKKGI